MIYVPDPEPQSVFVITAYDLGPKAAVAEDEATYEDTQVTTMGVPGR